jgi:hypothetical protein
MDILTVPFNFLDLEDIDADYDRSVERAVRVASLFQVCASDDNLGQSFLSTEPDPYALYIQRIRFERGSTEIDKATAQALVTELASQCRERLATVAQSQRSDALRLYR